MDLAASDGDLPDDNADPVAGFEDDRALATRLQQEELEYRDACAITGQVVGGLGPFAYAPATRQALVTAGARVRGLRVRCGSSGFQHGECWSLCPSGTRKADQHAVYAGVVGGVEINTTYYGMPADSTFAAWRAFGDRAAATHGHYDFVFKLHKWFVLSKQLCVDAAFRERWENDMRKFALVGDKVVALLVQLPASFQHSARNLAKLRALCELCQPRRGAFDPTFAVELRHPSWFEAGGSADALYALVAAAPRVVLAQVHGHAPNTALDPDRWYPPHADALRCARGKAF